MKYLIILVCALALSLHLEAQERQYLVHFEFNKSIIPDSSMLGLMKILAMNQIEQVVIEGHCDSIGSKQYNYDLSEKRANEVKKLLTQNGIDTKLIKTCIGYGKDQPLTLNASEEDRQQNRRVVVHFSMNEKNRKTTRPDTTKALQTFDKKEIKAGNKIILKNMFFYGTRHVLKPESMPALQNLVTLLKTNPTLKIEIQGHVCCTTTEFDGYDIDTDLDNLSIARAKMVYDYLVQISGIDKKRLSYKGYGGTQKITLDEHTEELQQINRRVEIKVIEE